MNISTKECLKKFLPIRKIALAHSDPGKILDLVMSLTDDRCCDLQLKINEYLKEECNAELIVIMEVQTECERMEACVQTIDQVVLPRKHKLLLPKRFIDALRNKIDVNLILSESGSELLEIVSAFVERDNPKKRVIATPICADQFSVLVFVVNPKIMHDRVPIVVQECFTYIWPILKKAISLEYERTLKQKCQQLLRVAKHLFTKVGSVEVLLQLVMEKAKQLVQAEYCSVYLIDMEKMELEEWSCEENENDGEKICRRLPMNIGITGRALSTGYIVNTRNAKEHKDFNALIDQRPGVVTKTMLCFPVRDESGIIGVGQLINKIDDPYFDAMDEEAALAFSIYCGVCIVHSVVYQKLQEAHIRSSLANELVIYHMKVNDAEVARIEKCKGFHDHPHLKYLDFNTRALPPRELVCYIVKMFTDLGFINKFKIKLPKFIRFILHVKKGYRNVPYHNWGHGFNVCQWAYAAIINFKIIKNGYLNDLQAFSYLLAALVHDVDHRGTTNNFQIQRQTPIAVLYSHEGSVLERHHFAQTVCILNTEGCDILESLPRKDYDRVLMMLRDYILASDLINFFKNLDTYKMLAEDFQRGNRVHTSALQALLMNAADVSDQLKEWSAVKKSVVAVLTEFFQQGDIEKSRGNTPTAMMDRDLCFIPDIEIQFITNVCKPLFSVLSLMIPEAEVCMKPIESHLERWEASKPVFTEAGAAGGLALLQSDELDNLIELEIQRKKNAIDEETTEDT